MGRLTNSKRFPVEGATKEDKTILSFYRNWMVFLANSFRPAINNTRYVEPSTITKKSKFLKEEPLTPEQIFLGWIRAKCWQQMCLQKFKISYMARKHTKFAFRNFSCTQQNNISYCEQVLSEEFKIVRGCFQDKKMKKKLNPCFK